MGGFQALTVEREFKEAEERAMAPRNIGEEPAREDSWKPIYTKILLATQQGLPIEEIAKNLRMSSRQVSRVRGSTYFINKLAALNTKITERITEKRCLSIETNKAREVLTKAALFAARKVIKLGRSGTPEQRIQFDACRDILDRAGLKPIEVLETRERVYSPAEVASAKAILLETETIVKRLETKSSPFVLPKEGAKKLESSDTDKAHARQPKSDKPT